MALSPPWVGILAVCCAQTGDAAGVDAPPLVPSGMDLLYDDRIPFDASGEPRIAIGLMTGKQSVALRVTGPTQVDFYEAGTLKQASLSAGGTLRLELIRAQSATRRHYVDLAGVPWNRPEVLDATLDEWRERGFSDVEALERGMVFGLGGRVLDNREYRVVVGVPSSERGTALAQQIYREFGQRALVRSKLRERPWGELRVVAGTGPLGTATSYVRIAPLTDSSEGTIIVEKVEHGRGYRWHGFEDRAYRGEIYVVVDPEGQLAVVNVLGAEHVLAGVVPSEIFASAPDEALKAQSVAARNHLLAKLGRRHHGDPFHLCSEQHCQVYSGRAKENERATAAVLATRGEALFHDHGLVHAVYSSTCGGHTEDNEAVWGDTPSAALRGRPDFDPARAPELARFADGIAPDEVSAWVSTQPRTFCSQASSVRLNKFRWERTFTGEETRRLVRGAFPRFARVDGLRVAERGPGGKVMKLVISGRNAGGATIAQPVLLELPIRRLFDNLNSGTFTVETTRAADGSLDRARFVGAGWGHGVGMCQLGAIGRAEAGHGYRKILAHYYNGATLATLY